MWVVAGSPNQHYRVARDVLRALRTSDGVGWHPESVEVIAVRCTCRDKVGTVRARPGIPTLMVDEPELDLPIVVTWDEDPSDDWEDTDQAGGVASIHTRCRRCGHVVMPTRSEVLEVLAGRKKSLYAHPVAGGVDPRLRRRGGPPRPVGG